MKTALLTAIFVVSTSAALWAAFLASDVRAELPEAVRNAQIVILGEQHDNPDHHKRQAQWVQEHAPKALVFEMLTPQQAARADVDWDTQAELDAVLEWSASAWPAFDMYYPIFAAAPNAVIYGAGVPRAKLREELGRPIASHPLAAQFGLDKPAAPEEQAAREAGQAVAHCGALPEEMLPVMVDAQRLRDAALADAALRALRHTGGPVVIITGNGHARTDWGVPALLAYAAPEIEVFSLGQGEGGAASGGTFTLTLDDAPAPAREDPCAAFAD